MVCNRILHDLTYQNPRNYTSIVYIWSCRIFAIHNILSGLQMVGSTYEVMDIEFKESAKKTVFVVECTVSTGGPREPFCNTKILHSVRKAPEKGDSRNHGL